MKNFRDITLATAGIFQACTLVRQVAEKGLIDIEPFTTSISSLFKVEVNTVEEVYGGPAGVKLGLHVLQNQLNGQAVLEPELIRYIVRLLQIEKTLKKDTSMLYQLRSSIEKVKIQAIEKSVIDDELLEQLADIYCQTVGTYSPRIHVRGKPNYLADPNIVHRIRALLLAGVRSTILWRQVGGSRLHLFFFRKKLLEESEKLLK